MKTAAKIFIIIGCVMLFWLIYPVFIGVMAYKKLDTACSKNELAGLAIAVLLCVNVLAGIFMLCMSDQDLQENTGTSTAAWTAAQPHSIKTADSDRAFDELIKLKQLRDEGIISEETYNLKKAQYMQKI